MVAIARVDPAHRLPPGFRKPSRHRDEAGAELVEFAFVLPLLLLVIVGIFDFGFLFQRYEVVTNAAREGARAAVLPDYQGQTAAVQSRVQTYLTNAGLTEALATPCGTAPCVTVEFGVNVPIDATHDITASRVTVRYPHRYLFLGPIATLFGGDFTSVELRAVSTMRRE
jgi:Flp pilus assembly protein TadG